MKNIEQMLSSVQMNKQDKADLINYLKNNNGGNEAGDNINRMINVTYEELVNLRNNSKLVPGAKYRMIDYETMTSQEGTQSAGHPFDLILTALNERTLDEKCSAIQSERDTDGYFANSNLAAWDIMYCLNNDVVKYPWAATKSLTITMLGIPIQCLYNGIYVYFGLEYESYLGTNAFDGFIILIKNQNPTNGDDLIILSDKGIEQNLGSSISSITFNLNDGKGVIYKLVDEFDNSVPWDFKNITFTNSKNWQHCYTFYSNNGISEDGSMNSSCANNHIYLPLAYLSIWGIPIIIIEAPFNVDIYFKNIRQYGQITRPFLEMEGLISNCSFIDCYNIIVNNVKSPGLDGIFKNLINVNFNAACNIIEMRNIKNVDINEKYINYEIVSQNSNGDIISYTDNDIYNILNPTT